MTILCLHAAVIAPVSEQSKPHQAILSSAKALIDKSEFEAAERNIWEVLQRQPNDPAAIHLLGRVRLRQGHFAEAESLLLRAQKLDPDLTSTYSDLGDLYLQLSRDADAEASYQHVLKIAPDDADANTGIASLWLSRGDYQRSLSFGLKVPAATRPRKLLPVLAADYLALGKQREASLIYRQVFALSPRDPETAAQLGNVLLVHGQEREALRLHHAMGPSPNPSAQQLLFRTRMQERLGDSKGARTLMADALRRMPHSAEILAEAGRLAALDKNWAKAAQLLAESATKNSEPHVLRQLVVAYLHLGQNEKAVETGRALVQKNSRDADNLQLLAAALIENRQWREADQTVTRLSVLRPNDPSSLLMQGTILFQEGDPIAATEALRKCLQLDPRQSEAHYYLGLIARQAGDVPTAIRELEQAIVIDARHTSALKILGALHLEKGELSAAREVLERAIKIEPNSAEGHYQLAILYRRLGMIKEAENHMELFQRLRPASESQPQSMAPTPKAPRLLL